MYLVAANRAGELRRCFHRREESVLTVLRSLLASLLFQSGNLRHNLVDQNINIFTASTGRGGTTSNGS